MRFWEYKHVRLNYKGRGITQEINILDIDGERLRGWSDNFSSNEIPTLAKWVRSLINFRGGHEMFMFDPREEESLQKISDRWEGKSIN